MSEAVYGRTQTHFVTVASAWVRPRRLLLVGDVLTLTLAVACIPALVASHTLPTSVLHVSYGVFSIVCAVALLLLMAVGGHYSRSEGTGAQAVLAPPQCLATAFVPRIERGTNGLQRHCRQARRHAGDSDRSIAQMFSASRGNHRQCARGD